jgi:hypothetical protein
VLVNKSVDLLNGIKEIAERIVVVECVDNVCDVLAHIYRNVPLTLENLGFFNVSDEVKFVYLHVGKNTSEHDVMLCGLCCQLTIRMDIIQQAEI